MINGKEVERKCWNYCTKDFSGTRSSECSWFVLKKDIRDKFTADEIDKASLLFCIFSFIPFTIVGNFIYLLNSKSNYKLPFRQIFTKILKDIYDQ